MTPHPPPAPVLSRLIAAWIDYLVITALYLFTSRAIPFVDWQFVLSFFYTALYYSICDSWLFSGRSLGKRIFGIRVVNLVQTDRLPYLGFSRSFQRYMLSFGFILLLTEIPVVLYREMELVAPSSILELHMLLVAAYFGANLCSVLLRSDHRALHDIITKSSVLRVRSMPSDVPHLTKDNLEGLLAEDVSRKWIGAWVGAALGALLWGFGLNHPAELHAIYQYRFPLEKRFHLRILEARRTPEGIYLQSIVLPSPQFDSLSETALGAGRFLVENKVVDPDSQPKITFEFFSVSPSDSGFRPVSNFIFDTQSGLVEEQPTQTHNTAGRK